ncbi:myosin light chain kinase, smooth muscle-like [Engraulis encrasicolus]|uniref:myosin light chain kinase, smooth muscle-like n=1 Tax=Engraulis encrasicolus TaxID=184585 RepID=UPI002FD3EDE1
MASHNRGQKKTYVSTFSLDLKSSRAPHSPQVVTVHVGRGSENGAVVKNMAISDHGRKSHTTVNTPPASKAAERRSTSGLHKQQQPQQEVKHAINSPLATFSKKSPTTTTREQSKRVATPKTRASISTDPAVKFQEAPEQVEVRVGETAQLACSYSSEDPVASCWIHNLEQPVVNEARSSVNCEQQSSSLKISDVKPEDAGSYTLFVRNRRGSTQHTIQLSVVDRPDPPASCPFVSQLKVSSLTLSWSGPCYDGGSAVTGYVVELKRVGPGEPGEWTQLTDQCRNTSYRVRSGLETSGEYRFRVRACNAVGTSDPSEESDCIKMEAKDGPQEESYVDVVIDTKHAVKDHYNVHERLGVGKFGQVFRLVHKETGRVCAGKFYKGRGSRDKEAARKEIELMNELHHPKLVQALGAYDTRSEIAMIMEYIAGGELFERIMDDNFEYTEPTSVRYMQQILEGMQYIHRKDIVHLDLKPENIVCVNTTGSLIKIIDFGLASKLDPHNPLMVMHGTPEFVAPEVIGYEPVCLTTDMWSIGVICYILLSGESPFQGNSDAETLALVTAASWEFDPESFEDITEEAKDFIRGLLKKDKSSRMSCEEALSHPWIEFFSRPKQRTTKSLNKGKMRRFLAKRKWKKAGKAVLALKRMAHLSSKAESGPESPNSSADELSLSPKAEKAVQSLEKTLRSEPRFQLALSDTTQPKGSTVRLICNIQGYPDPEVVWLQDEEPVAETERVQIEYEEDGTCTLIVADAEPEDSGIYKCRASNKLGAALCSARLTVEM